MKGTNGILLRVFAYYYYRCQEKSTTFCRLTHRKNDRNVILVRQSCNGRVGYMEEYGMDVSLRDNDSDLPKHIVFEETVQKQ